MSLAAPDARDPGVGAPGDHPRAVCGRCLRPVVVCYCARIPTLPTRTRVVLLQHPRERRMPVGTARMAHLALPGSVLRVGARFDGESVVEALTTDADTYLLFPGEPAIDVRALPRDRRLTLVVIDGTWSQARKLLALNPRVAALPRVAFSPRRPSEYRIRRQPASFCVSTIEALAEVLDVLEPEAGPFDRLLSPFRAMVDAQERFAREVHSARHSTKRVRPRPPAGAALAARVQRDWARLVCIQGEANAWPARQPDRARPEVVHWTAHRVATGERYQAVVAPRGALAPAIPGHVGLPRARLLAGVSRPAWAESWRAFLRPGDIAVFWGTFHRDLAVEEGVSVPSEILDVREALSHALRDGMGTVEDALRRLGGESCPFGAEEGRAWRRLSALVGVVEAVRRAQMGGALRV